MKIMCQRFKIFRQFHENLVMFNENHNLWQLMYSDILKIVLNFWDVILFLMTKLIRRLCCGDVGKENAISLILKIMFGKCFRLNFYFNMTKTLPLY